jgi:hypothetical protein
MKRVECEFEAEVLEAVVQSRWPDRAEEALRIHASACEICSEVAAVAGALGEASVEMRGDVVVPDSGRIWWLAQLRTRRDAAAAAGRPITAVQVVALACAAGALGACFGATSVGFQSALGSVFSWKAACVSGIHLDALVPSVMALLAGHEAVAAGVAAMFFLAPIAVYLAECRD